MNIDCWVAGYKVRAFDWIDKKNIYMHIEYYMPGASLSQPPKFEMSALIPKEQEETVRMHLEGVVVGLVDRYLNARDAEKEVCAR